MDIEYIKMFLDICHDAKKITELMPKLPAGMKPRHIHVIDTIFMLSNKKEYVKISDISEALKVTKPSITKLINELEIRKVLTKTSQLHDNRIITLSLTPLGKKYHEIYVDKYQKYLAELFIDIEEDDMRVTVETINTAYKIMKKRSNFDGI